MTAIEATKDSKKWDRACDRCGATWAAHATMCRHRWYDGQEVKACHLPRATKRTQCKEHDRRNQ